MKKYRNDKRKEPRYRVNKLGSIRCLVTMRQMDVEIKDMSASGARLRALASTTDMQDVELHILPEDLHVAAQIRWRIENELGVAIDNQNATINKNR